MSITLYLAVDATCAHCNMTMQIQKEHIVCLYQHCMNYEIEYKRPFVTLYEDRPTTLRRDR